MTYRVNTREFPLSVLLNAAQHVREKYNAPTDRVISDYLEQEFNVKFISNEYSLYGVKYEPADQLEFASEQDYLLFVLKWS
jgi:hypothetical protein